MNQKSLILVNTVLAVSVIVQYITVFAGFGRITGRIHEANGYLIGFLILVHIYLNRAWIKTVIFKYKRSSETR